MNRLYSLILGGFLLMILSASGAAERPLLEPEGWFSVPFVGITRIEPRPDGVGALYKGTIAYKNKLAFEQLRFDLSFAFDGEGDRAVLIQFDKQRRESSIDQHHLSDMSNCGYGLLFCRSGKVQLVRTEIGREMAVLMEMETGLDFAFPQRVLITQKAHSAGGIAFTVQIGTEGPKHACVDEAKAGYCCEGYLGLTIYEGRTSVTVDEIRIEGEEVVGDAGGPPRAVYMADYFEENGRRLVHWRYDETTRDYDCVWIERTDGTRLAQVRYPQDFWVVDSEPLDAVHLVAVDIDGNRGEAVAVRLVDDHAKYYSASPQARVGIQKGEPVAMFCLRPSGKPLLVKGFNYVRLRFGDHANFEAETEHYPSYYDPYDAETLFATMKKYGYNTVRVFVGGRASFNPGVAGDYEKTRGLYGPYMDNLIDFLERAQKYGIYVFPTMHDGELPRNRYYLQELFDATPAMQQIMLESRNAHNKLYLTKMGLEAKSQYIRDFLSYIQKHAPHVETTLLAIQMQNEFSLRCNQWPFDLKEGQVTTADGQTYDMADDDQRQACYENGVRKYHEEMVKAAKSVFPDLLVGEGAFTLRIVDKDPVKHYGVHKGTSHDERFPPTAPLMAEGPLDFFDIHIYHVKEGETAREGYRRDLESVLFYSPRMQELRREKVFLLGEFGSFKFIAETWDEAVKDVVTTRDLGLADQAGGFLFWTFDTYEQYFLWHALDGGEAFLERFNSMP